MQLTRVSDSGIPIVCVDRVPENVSVDSVSVDDRAGAELGVSHLISMGYRKIAIVTGPLSLENEQQRLQGYKKGLEYAAIPIDNNLIWHGNLRAEDVAAICKCQFLKASARPDAFFCTNGPTALGVLQALQDYGLKTPGDVGFVTFDELTSHEIFSPAITTVIQPAYEIGYQSAGILLRRIAEGPHCEDIATIRLPATLKVRSSSSPRKS
jgi:DNA-binding LacI/PurR family transcriptional regulator